MPEGVSCESGGGRGAELLFGELGGTGGRAEVVGFVGTDCWRAGRQQWGLKTCTLMYSK